MKHVRLELMDFFRKALHHCVEADGRNLIAQSFKMKKRNICVSNDVCMKRRRNRQPKDFMALLSKKSDPSVTVNRVGVRKEEYSHIVFLVLKALYLRRKKML